MNREQKLRAEQCGKWLLKLAAIGAVYALAVSRMGFGIPCIFHLLTGLQCPGCGVTRMCLALLHLDLEAAYSYNAGVLLAMPVLLGLAVWYLADYIRYGSRPQPFLTKRNILCLALVVYLIGFGVIRNR